MTPMQRDATPVPGVAGAEGQELPAGTLGPNETTALGGSSVRPGV